MKTVKLSFGKWSSGARGGNVRRCYRRVYIKGYKWTPIVIITWI